MNLDGVKNLKYPYFLLKELGIPFSMVVDRDVLSNYINSELEKSRDKKSICQFIVLHWDGEIQC